MYTLTRAIGLRQLLLEQLPALVVALAIAEWLYKFGSFTLECVAFLATWFVIDALIRFASTVLSRRRELSVSSKGSPQR